ncbi:MAG: hypothetical protein JKY84_00760 [Emcibacteraceae bacterium]|nr:hypothetical protein [Emcibacteraceae bacterium]
MSKTTKSKPKKLAKGVEEVISSRQGYSLSTTSFRGDFDIEYLKKISEETYPSTKGKPYGFAESLSEFAVKLLQEKGLPYATSHMYRNKDYYNLLPLLPNSSQSESYDYYKNKFGHLIGIMSLDVLFAHRGYQKFDDEYLLAKVIMLCRTITDPNTKREVVVWSAYDLGILKEQINQIWKKDTQTKKSRKRNSLKNEIRKAMIAIGPEALLRDVLKYLCEHKKCTDLGGLVTYGECGSMTIESFGRRVAEQKKLLKEPLNKTNLAVSG